MNNTFETFAHELLKNGLTALVPSSVPQSVTAGFVQGAVEALTNPQVQEGLSSLFAGSFCHSGLDVAQDALDACEHGQLSHEAALKIVAIALADDQARKIKRG
jgi:hypothetical protein